MKVYYKNILRIPIFWYHILLYMIPLYLWLVKDLGNATMLMCFWAFFTLMFAIVSTTFGYIVMDNEGFTLKNAVYPFWKATYAYKDIRKIEFCNAVRGGIYLNIHLQDLTVKSRGITCVREKDLKEIAGIFKAHKVSVELTGKIVQDLFSH